MSSVALPKLAFRSPPMAGDVRLANSSVDWPIYLASGRTDIAARKKTITGDTPAKEAPIAKGTKTRSAGYIAPICLTAPGQARPAGGLQTQINFYANLSALNRLFPPRAWLCRIY